MCTYLVSSPIIIVYKIQGEQGVILSMKKKKQNIKKYLEDYNPKC